MPRYFAFSRGRMVNQLCTQVVGFVMHHMADAVPSEASTLCFLVISGSVQLACSLAVRMPVPISVVLGLPTEQESIADVGALVCSNLRINDGLSPIPWNAVFENFAEVCPVEYSCVPQKVEGEQECEDEVEEVGATPGNDVYGTPKQSRGPSKKDGHTRKGDENKACSSRSKGKGNKKAQASPRDEFAAAGTDSQSSASKKAKIHKKPSVSNRMYVVRTLSSSMWAKAIGLGLSTLHGYDHYELICAEPDPVSGGTRLAKYPSLCQPRRPRLGFKHGRTDSMAPKRTKPALW